MVDSFRLLTCLNSVRDDRFPGCRQEWELLERRERYSGKQAGATLCNRNPSPRHCFVVADHHSTPPRFPSRFPAWFDCNGENPSNENSGSIRGLRIRKSPIGPEILVNFPLMNNFIEETVRRLFPKSHFLLYSIGTDAGAVAQLGERCVRNAEVEGSTPFRSNKRALPYP